MSSSHWTGIGYHPWALVFMPYEVFLDMQLMAMLGDTCLMV